MSGRGLLEELAQARAQARAEERADDQGREEAGGDGPEGDEPAEAASLDTLDHPEPLDVVSLYEAEALRRQRERLRDQLAGQALQGLLQNPAVLGTISHTPLEKAAARQQRFARFAEAAYALADAMLAAKGPGDGVEG